MSNRKVFKLSLIAAACMAVSVPVFAGQIIGIQQGAPSPLFEGADDWKNGFGGWNLDNVNVKIIDIETGLETTKVFDPDNVTYSYYPEMVVGEGFVSEIYDRPFTDAAAVKMGTLHGKDWPKGEPSGVKVITRTDITEINPVQENGKPRSCIMSTSYHPLSEELEWVDGFTLPAGTSPEDGVLGSAYINPTLCESPFQTHKRFKIKALPTTIDGPDKGVDVVFDVGGSEAPVRDYMVLQKLNNYTGKRLEGYKIEVGFGVGTNFVNAADVVVTGTAADLRLSIGKDEKAVKVEGVATAATEDIWAPDALAKFSAGLFGTADKHHLTDGFFSTETAFYNVVLTNPTTIESTGGLAPAYTKRFGKWLPAGWETKGVFYDDDKNPTTDNQLMAFWGEDSDGTYKWLLGQAGSFAPVGADQLYTWANNTGMPDGTNQYSVDVIDDMLNLGLTYIVEVGDISTFPTANFTIRMTPIAPAVVVDEDTATPGWIIDDAITLAAAVPADYVPPVDDTATTTSSGSSASVMDNAGMFATLLAFLGLGGWIVRRKLAK